MPPSKLTDQPLTLEKNPLEGKGPTKVEGTPDPAASGSGPAGAPKKLDRTPTKDGKIETKETSWVEVRLVDDQDRPVDAAYQVTLPDGTVREGYLNDEGWARVSGFEPGPCKVCFPEHELTTWSKQ